MNLISFDPLRTITLPGVSVIKPEHFFRAIDRIRAADWILFPAYLQVNSLVFGLKRHIFPVWPLIFWGTTRWGIEGRFDGRPLSLEPGVETTDVLTPGVSARVDLTDTRPEYTFRFAVNLNGSQGLSYVPVGRTTSATMRYDSIERLFLRCLRHCQQTLTC